MDRGGLLCYLCVGNAVLIVTSGKAPVEEKNDLSFQSVGS